MLYVETCRNSVAEPQEIYSKQAPLVLPSKQVWLRRHGLLLQSANSAGSSTTLWDNRLHCIVRLEVTGRYGNFQQTLHYGITSVVVGQF